MSTMESQITGVSIVCSTVGSGADQRKHRSSASLAFMREILRSPVNISQKRPVTRKMFPFDDVIMMNTGHGNSISHKICTCFCFDLYCCGCFTKKLNGLICDLFIHFLQDHCTDTGAIILPPGCQWSNTGRYVQIECCLTTSWWEFFLQYLIKWLANSL